MESSQWSGIKHFSESENWGDVSKISFDLVKTLDDFREFIGTSIQIDCGTQGAHVTNSEHYLGHAVDIMFPDMTLVNLFDLWISAQRFSKFGGIGIYPHWVLNSSSPPRGGLHVDVRQDGIRDMWLGTPSGAYIAPTKDSLRFYGIL